MISNKKMIGDPLVVAQAVATTNKNYLNMYLMMTNYLTAFHHDQILTKFWEERLLPNV